MVLSSKDCYFRGGRVSQDQFCLIKFPCNLLAHRASQRPYAIPVAFGPKRKRPREAWLAALRGTDQRLELTASAQVPSPPPLLRVILTRSIDLRALDAPLLCDRLTEDKRLCPRAVMFVPVKPRHAAPPPCESALLPNVPPPPAHMPSAN
jgi:hypothetical protein